MRSRRITHVLGLLLARSPCSPPRRGGRRRSRGLLQGRSVDLVISTPPARLRHYRPRAGPLHAGAYSGNRRSAQEHPRSAASRPPIPRVGRPRDGSMFATIPEPGAVQPLLACPRRCTTPKFSWIGSANTEVGLLVSGTPRPFTKIET